MSSLEGGAGLNTSDTADQSDCQPDQGRREVSRSSLTTIYTYLLGELGTILSRGNGSPGIPSNQSQGLGM